MLEEYDEIISFFENVCFEEKYFTNISASICLICGLIVKNEEFLEKINNMCKEKGFSLYNKILECHENKKEITIALDYNPPYVNRLINFYSKSISF